MRFYCQVFYSGAPGHHWESPEACRANPAFTITQACPDHDALPNNEGPTQDPEAKEQWHTESS